MSVEASPSVRERFYTRSTGRCIHELVETQAAKTPDAIAIAFGTSTLSYRELDERANRLANYLIDKGVARDVFVAVPLERSLEMVVALLAVLKAGGAYVPLDPAYPAERLAQMTRETRAILLLTQRRFASRGIAPGIPRLELDAQWEEVARYDADRPYGRATPDDLAYAMYTSGSTGTPRGVLVPHRGVVNHNLAIAEYFQLCASDRVSQCTSLSFDISVEEIFPTLMTGATLVLHPPGVVGAGHDFTKWIREQRISVVDLPTAFWHEWVSYLSQHTDPLPPELRLVVVGGQKASSQVLATWRKRTGAGVRWINGYGPTEATIASIFYSPDDPGERELAADEDIPIGRAIAGTAAYILDSSGEPCDAGVIGELFVGGAGVARGYLDHPALTAEKFLPDPFSPLPGARMYRTGDLARRKAHGRIEFAGRIDDQVKVRGFRVELGEVEAVLRQHPDVHDVAVIARDVGDVDKRLAGYVVLKHAGARVADLSRFLKARLPAHMVPPDLMVLDALPLTATGKTDKARLPVPRTTRETAGVEFVAPEGDVQRSLARIWSAVLGIDEIGARDNFFDLGGHSLRATQVASRIRDEFGIEIPLSEVFAQTTIADLARVVDSYRAEPGAQVARIPRTPRDRAIPLSFSQERVWFLQQLDPTSLAYNFQTFLEFRGPLDVVALRKSLDALIERHEIFRTTFVDSGGGVPVQRIHPAFAVELPIVDLRHVPPDRRQQHLAERTDELLARPFDVSRLPLVRWTLFQLGDDEFAMLHVEHHLVHDGWSFNVFRRELLELYLAYTKNETPALKEPEIQFADFAVWQRESMSGDALDGQLDYWKKQLSDAPALELPTDRSRPLAQTFAGAVHEIELGDEQYAALRSLSESLGTTLFVTLGAAFFVLLHRYSGQDDVSIGTGVASRRWTETEGLLGMLVNNVVLRSVIRDDPTFRSFISGVKRTTLEAFANQDAPFDAVVRAVGAPSDNSRNPLFQVMFSFHDSPLDEPSIPNVDFHCVEIVSNRSAKFDLNIVAVPHAEQRSGRERSHGRGGVTVIWEYNTALFDRETVEQMAHHYRVLLDSIIANPDTPVFDLALMDDAECEEILTSHNRTTVAFPSDTTIHETFEAVVARTPEVVAIVAGDIRLTYRELDDRASALARRLEEAGVTHGSTVGVFLDRDAEMIVGLLGILKAGGAYVPMDVGLPDDRLKFIAEETRIGVVLVTDATRERAGRLSLRAVTASLDAESAGSPTADVRIGTPGNPLDLAYIIFTSGSTGRPKGVAVPHRAVLRLVFGADYVGLGAERRILHMAPLSFDSSTFEIWGALLHGAAAVIHVGDVPTPPRLGEILRRDRIDTLWLTASMFNAVIDDAPEALGEVRQLLVGGEALSVPHIRRAQERLPHTRIINGYGPTESTTFTCCHPITERIDAAARSVPIGTPIGNTRVYLLDRRLNPVPIGVAGELHVGGAGLAHGYFGRSELTADRFIPDPFGPSGSRMYRTGDFARYRRDGLIEFVGRVDDQVKVRGYRIELGEIENALREQPSIRDAAVVVRDDVQGGRALVAYLVPASGAIDVESTREALRQLLPVYMVPSRFVVMDALPLSPTGKVLRRLLPAPTSVAAVDDKPFVEATSDVERTVAGIWRDVLGIDRLSVHDNFFDLGGHSLLATRIVARVREDLLIGLPLRTLFEAPTVAALSKRVSDEATSRLNAQNDRSPWRYVFLLKPSTGGAPIFFLPGGHGGDYEFLVYARLVHHVDGFTFYGLRARSADGVESAHDSVERMAADYIAEIRAVQPTGPYRLVGNCIGGVVAYEVARQLEQAGHEVKSLVLMDTDFPTARRYVRELWNRVGDRWNLSYYSERLPHHLRTIAELPWKERWSYMFAKASVAAKEVPVMGHSLDPAVSVKVGYVDTLRRYRPKPYGGSLAIIASQHDASDPTAGWSRVVRGKISVHPVRGDHDSYIRDFVTEAAMRLKDCLS